MSDTAAIARWAKANPQIARQATAKAPGDAATGVISDHAAGKLAEKFDVGPLGQAMLQPALERAAERVREKRR